MLSYLLFAVKMVGVLCPAVCDHQEEVGEEQVEIQEVEMAAYPADGDLLEEAGVGLLILILVLLLS